MNESKSFEMAPGIADWFQASKEARMGFDFDIEELIYQNEQARNRLVKSGLPVVEYYGRRNRLEDFTGHIPESKLASDGF